MDIKRAKQEIKDAVEAYLLKDTFGEYQIPAIRQRPILLMGPPGIGKTHNMEQIEKEMQIVLVSYTIGDRQDAGYGADRKGDEDRTCLLYDHPSYETECGGTAVYQRKRVRRTDVFRDRVYNE